MINDLNEPIKIIRKFIVSILEYEKNVVEDFEVPASDVIEAIELANIQFGNKKGRVVLVKDWSYENTLNMIKMTNAMNVINT